MEKELEQEPKTETVDGEETNIYGSKLKDIWKIKELQDTIDALYRVIGELYVENLRLKAINKLAIKKDEK